MATIPRTNQPTGNSVSIVTAWLNLANGDVGEPVAFSQYADKSVQVVGTFGVGGTLRFEGSNDGVNFSPLTDAQGNNLDFTSSKIELVAEATLQVRPRVVAGDGSTNLSVYSLMKE